MERMCDRVVENAPALVLANPGTQVERIYFIKEVVTSSSGAWFRSDVNLSRGTPAYVIIQLKSGPGQKTTRLKLFGKVVRSETGGFAVAFEYP